MVSTVVPDLEPLLREADTETLLAVIRDRAPEIDVPSARQALRNPFATREVVEALIEIPGLTSAYELRADLALHAATPEVPARRWIAGLYWRDLVRVGAEARVRPALRRVADRTLAKRLPGLAAGEKISIARRAGAGALVALAHDASPRVWSTLLENPRLTEGLLIQAVVRETTPPQVLAEIAGSPKWAQRYDLRLALSRNPRTPEETAFRLVPQLRKVDQRLVAGDRRLPAARRRRAKLLLGEAV